MLAQSSFKTSKILDFRSIQQDKKFLHCNRSQYHEILLVKQLQANSEFQISDMKIFSEIFNLIYKIILHLILLLIKQHELMIFRSESNVIHRTDSDYISTKYHFSTLNSKKIRRLKFKINELYITAQSVRQISCNSRSV